MKLAKLKKHPKVSNICAVTAIAAAIAVLLPFLLGGSLYALDLAKITLIYALFVVSWDIFCGITGEVSFGHTFLIGTAAFTTALAQSNMGLHPVMAIFLGTLAGSFGGLLVGVLTLRHTSAVFAMVTMAVQLTFHRTLFIHSDIFGGEEGVLIKEPLFGDAKIEYILIAMLAVAALVFAMALRESRFGRQLRASGGDTRVGLASGVPVSRVRLIGATVSGFLASLGGSMFAMHNMLANHEMAGDALAGLIFLLAVAGGAGTLIGPWIAAVVYVAGLRESLIFLGEAEPMIVFGILVVVIWFFPDGIGTGFHRLRSTNRTTPQEKWTQ